MREFSMKDKIGYTLGRSGGLLLYRTVSGNVFDRILHARTESKILYMSERFC